MFIYKCSPRIMCVIVKSLSLFLQLWLFHSHCCPLICDSTGLYWILSHLLTCCHGESQCRCSRHTLHTVDWTNQLSSCSRTKNLSGSIPSLLNLLSGTGPDVCCCLSKILCCGCGEESQKQPFIYMKSIIIYLNHNAY